jgi:very-short-patch-repair endonuclease
VPIEQERLLSLVEFAQQTARLRSAPVASIAQHGIFALHEHQLQRLPGFKIGVNGNESEDEVWLTVERLHAGSPPEVTSAVLRPWIQVAQGPMEEPKLKDVIDGASLISAGTHRSSQTSFSREEQSKPSIDPREVVVLAQYGNSASVRAQFSSYLESKWRPWAEEEKLRRRTIHFYSELFTLKQRLEGGIVEAQLELAWSVGMGIWTHNGTSVAYPLITRLVELSLDPVTAEIEVRPRDVDARVELDWYAGTDNPGVAGIEKAAKEFFGSAPKTFSPFDRGSFEPLLRTAYTNLDPRGVYWPDVVPPEDRSLPKPDETLKVTDTWVLFARPRTNNIFLQDLEKFKKEIAQVSDKSQYPPAVVAIATEPDTTNPDIKLPSFRGVSASYHMEGISATTGDKPRELYFPKPFNDEQVRIVQLLDAFDGVIVQGPPGTGKTHTIANVICHYLADGKRVLVTSMKDPALAVLHEFLPKEIRPLAISLLTSEQEGMKQFEHAIQKIAYEVQSIDRSAMARAIDDLQASIDGLHGKLAGIDRKIGYWAKKNVLKVLLDGDEIHPQDAAKEVVDDTTLAELIPDAIDVSGRCAPQFADEDVVALRAARRTLALDIDYIGASLPMLAEFPDTRDLLEAHRDLSQFELLSQSVANGNVPAIVASTEETLSTAKALLDRIGVLRQIRDDVVRARRPWTVSMRDRLRRNRADTMVSMLEALGSELNQAVRKRAGSISRPVDIPSSMEMDMEIVEAIEKLRQGKSPFGLMGLIGKSEKKKRIQAIRILGNVPKSSDDWEHVAEHVGLLRQLRELALRWNALARELGIDSVPNVEPESGITAAQHFSLYCKVKSVVEHETALCAGASRVFPAWQHGRDVADSAQRLVEFEEALQHHLTRNRLSNVWQVKERFQKVLEGKSGRVVEDIRRFLGKTLGDPKVADAGMQSEWSALMAELSRVLGLGTSLAVVREVSDKVEASGAPRYAALLRQPLVSTVDGLLPDNWRNAWRRRRLANYLESIDAQDELKKLAKERHEVESDLARAYREVVAKRTWLKLATNASPSIRAALQAYLNAIQRIGRGTGKRAVRYRHDARVAAAQANPAVPCWIMPHYRVSESLPAELGCFDLVVIDEASQSDLTALPALLRAQKVLVVGDDKQVSPEGVGLEEEKIRSLMTRFLGNQVETYRAQMSPERSIYDLYKVVFAKSAVMLREHFRCVAPIIEYSKREFYDHQLRPLRIPKASERLDPPLIDVLVEDGFRKGDINPAEARFIVDEIKRIASDPKLAGRTIGVVSLLADKQALAVWERLTQELGPEAMEEHDIACGDARTFQGKERDIMFLSMVCAPNEVGGVLSRDAFAQRFNVAASRAKDRMYLVRSVDLEHLSGADRHRRSLISHFAAPFAQDEGRTENLRTLCESPFEREVYDELSQRGYWVTPQVRVGQYRIDLVVEGHNDTRLAIECDGDRYHGADKWAEDMQRQRVLERAGWMFWRCFASTFIRRRKEVVEDLLKTLSDRGVEPIGSEGAPRSVHTEQRRVSALEVPAPHQVTTTAPEAVAAIRAHESLRDQARTNEPSASDRLGAILMNISDLQTFQQRARDHFDTNTTPHPVLPTSGTSAVSPIPKELKEYCQRHDLEVRDMRAKRGALWVDHLAPGDEIGRQLTEWGFRLARGKGFWRK